jgi:tRNA-specific 2-thiouridylase
MLIRIHPVSGRYGLQSVAVAMSGGVDSSVAALLLKRQGYDVVGVHLKLFDAPPDDEPCIRSCCSAESAERARSVCAKLDIPFYVLNYREKFEEQVIKPFAKAYLDGQTPNPCISCNSRIKFEALLEQMRAIDIDCIATGHYIRKVRQGNEWLLLRGKDPVKDQTYFLYMLTQSILDHSLFPVGDFEKREIRKLALDAGLEVAEQTESQEICFVLTDSYTEIIESMYPGRVSEGRIIDRSGHLLGHHKGIIHYTIGQRRGLGISAPEPLYVLEIIPGKNTIVVGAKEEVFSNGLIFGDETWVSGVRPENGSRVDVQIRYNSKPKPAIFEVMNEGNSVDNASTSDPTPINEPAPIGEPAPINDPSPKSEPAPKSEENPIDTTPINTGNSVNTTSAGLRITFESPQPAVTPGQAVVLYHDDQLLGGGVIRSGN